MRLLGKVNRNLVNHDFGKRVETINECTEVWCKYALVLPSVSSILLFLLLFYAIVAFYDYFNYHYALFECIECIKAIE